MRAGKTTEVIVGLFLLTGIVALVLLAVKVSGLGVFDVWEKQGYVISAHFDNVGDLKVRAPVTVAGVRVGAVDSIHLDPKTYQGNVVLRIENHVQLPKGTAASILTQGLLGSHYVGLTPGYGETLLKPGAVLEETHSALLLEQLIGKFMFNSEKKDS